MRNKNKKVPLDVSERESADANVRGEGPDRKARGGAPARGIKAPSGSKGKLTLIRD